MPFAFHRPDVIPDLIIIEPRVFVDERGWFQETYRESQFEQFGIKRRFCQDNHSRSTTRGVIRGLHYQLNPAAQGKLVRCTAGSIFDVGVDIRKGSPTFGKWVGVTLSADNFHMLWVPEGFAHAFCTLTDVAEVLYKTTSEYSSAHERCIRWNDPALGIEWPVSNPELSPKDASAPSLVDAENNFVWTGAI
jgi:dTDP-4-dehydrorhamnose 3,5-epimerase